MSLEKHSDDLSREVAEKSKKIAPRGAAERGNEAKEKGQNQQNAYE